MARSLSNIRMFSAYFADGIPKVVPRQGYTATTEVAGGETVVSKAVKGMSNRTVKTRFVVAKEEETWMPDPKTGFYGPGNCKEEIDAAELRALMLKRKDLRLVVPQRRNPSN